MMVRHLLTACVLATCLAASQTTLAQPQRKLEIRGLSFSGNEAFSSERLKELMVSRPAGFLKSSYYYRAVFLDDLDNLTAFYYNQGYLDAAIVDTQVVVIDQDQHSVDITVGIEEGPLTRIESIGVFGNEAYPDSTLLSLVPLRSGDPCRRSLIQKGMLEIAAHYAGDGYLEASVQPELRRDPKTQTVLVDFTIREGRQSRVGEIRIEGLEKTNRNVVIRELLFTPGEIVRYLQLLRSERSLYLTGLFESVFVRPATFTDSTSGSRTILVEVREKKSGEFNVAVGYGSVEKAFGRVELASTSLAGTARKLGTSISGSFVKRSVEGSFTEPWTFGTRLQTDIRSSYEFVEEPGYIFTRLGVRVTVGRLFGSWIRANLTYRFENVRLRHISIDEPPQDLKPHVRSLTLSIIKDSRDNLFDPRKGTYWEWSNELAGSFLQGTNTFARSVIRGKKFLPLGRRTLIAGSFEIGWMEFFGGSREIPLNERFYAGGPNSIRGFEYQAVGPLDSDGDPKGGQFKLVWNVFELRRAIYKMIGIVVFLDLGNVWPQINDAVLADIRGGAGIGLRANTPIGIVRLDYGVNLDPERDEAARMISFGMGHAF